MNTRDAGESMKMSGSTGDGESAWADPGFFVHRSRIANAFRIIWQTVRPPPGHRTLPTRAGVLLICLSLGIGTAAFNTAHNILYIALALLLSSLLLSGVLSWLNFKGCRWRLQVEPHWRANEPTPVIVEISNTKSWLPTYGLWFRLCARQANMRTRIAQQGRLEAGENRQLEWLCTPPRRGRETVVIEGIVSTFPFGFLRKSITESYRREVIVWPARIRYALRRTPAHNSARSGHRRSRRGSGPELINLREYRPGDPLRVVHWKASARQQKLLVRETAEEGQANYCLIVRSRLADWPEPASFEKLCALAATLAEDLFMAGRLAAVLLNAGPPIPVRRISDLHAALSALAVLEQVEHLPAAPDVRPLVPLTLKPGNGETINCRIDGALVGEA